jgi:hypothetical protein
MIMKRMKGTKMKAIIESGDSFKKEISALSETEQKQVMSCVGNLPGLFQENGSSFYSEHLSQLKNICVGSEYELSLYVLEVGNGVNVLLTFDEDPIFEKLHITLHKLAQKNLADAYLSVAGALTKALETEFCINKEMNSGQDQSTS